MLVQEFSQVTRGNKTITTQSDLVVVGGGLAGLCCAIAAARDGITVTLVQDRPVLGGNASSEVRLWTLGATSHMGNNNRWSREGGIIDEILVENMYRNKEGNTLIFDTILLEKVVSEKNITLLLNTSVYDVKKSDPNTISQVVAFCSQNSTTYELNADLFCDASGDGIVGFQAGAAFRMGAETVEEFGELFAPDIAYGELLGHTIYFYSKNVGAPVKYVAPEFALKDITKIPRYKVLNDKDFGCRLWWLEYGGRRDTIHESEDIKWELWKVVYGVWDYIKNSGEFPDAENLTLEWVGTIPGKRESRRFEGHYMIKQQDLVLQSQFDDAVSFGGWAVDLHPSDGVYDSKPGCTQYHSKGVYQIPMSTMISKNINNLFLGGRLISATHVAFGSTRVMATTALSGQAVGYGAAQCIKNKIKPAQLLEQNQIKELQQTLSLNGQSIPGIAIDKEANLLSSASISSSSTFKLDYLQANGKWFKLEIGVAQLLPLEAHTKYDYTFSFSAEKETTIQVDLRTSERLGSYTPDAILETKTLELQAGEQEISFSFDSVLTEKQYAFITFLPNELVSIRQSEQRATGLVSVFNAVNKAVNNLGKQTPPDNMGLDSFEFWIPQRRPNGQNFALTVSPAIELYSTENITNGFVRPYLGTNAWAASVSDANPKMTFEWNETKEIKNIKLFFDTDYDHAMESSLMGHPESVMPFCTRGYKISDQNGNVVYETKANHQTINTVELSESIKTNTLVVEFESSNSDIPVSVFEIFIS
ncbi:FAD-dependent oxidoreductase [Flavobacterium nackdongense]|uniref:FAD-dependent oxidoreductase n=1 Tax=Flavobacterium nackdongense TaxID=2547394 RepID=A0A4P6YHN8_9FLAO|nr:FAD-dependent oxidoreductase [Flavobacterium nackdongense]QBN20387.1 FAD-dependent oxidoreductase [Flavobacterium nackdongense]